MSNATETETAAPEQTIIQPDQEPGAALTSEGDEALVEPAMEPGESADTGAIGGGDGPDDFVAPAEAPGETEIVEDADTLVEPTESPPN